MLQDALYVLQEVFPLLARLPAHLVLLVAIHHLLAQHLALYVQLVSIHLLAQPLALHVQLVCPRLG
jgi:hypothetical protein